jgi:hypothetical protein
MGDSADLSKTIPFPTVQNDTKSPEMLKRIPDLGLLCVCVLLLPDAACSCPLAL